MKRQAFMILASLTLLVTLTATSVYSQFNSVLEAKVPFEFVIGSKAFPAGEYTVTYLDAHLMRIQSQDRSKSMFVVTGPADDKKMGNGLVFNRYGDQYFLSTVWRMGDLGRAIRMSPSELKLIQGRSALDSSQSEAEIVSIMLVGK